MSAVTFGWRDPVVSVLTQGYSWPERVASLFPDYVLSDGPAPRVLEVRPSQSGGGLLGAGEVEEVDSHEDLLALVEIELARALLSCAGSVAHLHAAGALIDGRAVLALGPSGSGKSSLAFAWNRAGYSLLGDDIVFIDAEGAARSFRRLMKVEQSRMLDANFDPTRTLAWDPDNSEAWFTPGRDGWVNGAVPVGVVARVRFRAGAPLWLEHLSQADTLNLLVHSLLDTGAAGAGVLERLASVAAGAVGLDMRFSDSHAAASVLAREVSRL